MKLKLFAAAGATVAFSLIAASSGYAADGSANANVSFFRHGDASAGWVNFSPPPPGDSDSFSIELRLGPPPATCLPTSPVNCPFAGATLHGVKGAPPATPPAFDFHSSVTGPGDGSPRLHIALSDDGSIELRPLAQVAGTWTHESGSSNDWDSHGGTCGFAFEVSYAAALACHPGATVTDAFVVTDSAWGYPATGYTHLIDNIQYGDQTITAPH